MIKRYFLYDPEGDGFQAFATAEARDEAAAKALPLYIVDGEWDETVFEVVAGEITHITEKTNVVRRPDDLNDDSEDASGEYWQPYTSEKFNVKMQPAPACEAAARERDALNALCDRQADILSRVAVALRGPELPLTKWSHADLPERAEAILTDHICEQCGETIPLEHPCNCQRCWNEQVGMHADLRARFTAAIDDLQEMAAVMKKHQMLPHTSAAIAERVAELTGNNFQPDDLRERIEALANEMETDDRAGKLAHWIGAIRAELRKEASQ